MATPIKKQIQLYAIQVIQNSGGVRYTSLKTQIKSDPSFSMVPDGTIHDAIRRLVQDHPSQVTKPAPGLYAPATTLPPSPTIAKSPNEDQFYQPFADFLRDDLEEATVTVALGGSSLKMKWGTPDVVGVFKPPPGAIVNFHKEIVSAEIKVDPREYVTAFGQATAYRLFSTKAYVVMPDELLNSPTYNEASNRLEALCMLFGIGYITFDATNPNSPNFTTRIRARRYTPEMYYVNKFAQDLQSNPSTKSLFITLFS